MKVYISGPMTGIPESNFPAFHAAAESLRRLGFDVVNPAEINPGQPPADGAGKEAFEAFYNACLRADIREMMACDAVALLPGWQHSKGANLELHIAHRVGMHIYSLHELLLDQFDDIGRTA